MEGELFHAGERALQARTGMAERIAQAARVMIRDHMPDQHRAFFELLPTLYAAALDAEGQPWATVWHGTPGFVTSPQPERLAVRLSAPLQADDVDPVNAALAANGPGAAVGLLGLQPATRRRNRMNGILEEAAGAGALSIRVAQSFGNCPQYIQARDPQPAEGREPGPVRRLGPWLDADALALVRAADTMFIASASGPRVDEAGVGGQGVDVSHRGGRPGFVGVEDGADGHRLLLPDYAGNRLFNTLGNLLAWPRAGLLFVDWTRGDLLHLAARAEVVQDGPALAAHAGAQRLVRLDLNGGLWRPAALPLRWSAPVPAREFADLRPAQV